MTKNEAANLLKQIYQKHYFYSAYHIQASYLKLSYPQTTVQGRISKSYMFFFILYVCNFIAQDKKFDSTYRAFG